VLLSHEPGVINHAYRASLRDELENLRPSLSNQALLKPSAEAVSSSEVWPVPSRPPVSCFVATQASD